MTMHEAAAITGGQCHGADAVFHSVSNDTRTLQPHGLYVALRGERFDGHRFVPQAFANGAAGVLVEHDDDVDGPALVVPDSLVGLQMLAAEWRARFHQPVVAVTGSNGKTTVKEMIASILSHAGETLMTTGNLNNHIGLPLTLLRLKPEHDYAVVEMGMNHAGEISRLTGIGRPNVALVNNAAAAHLEGLGTVANVAKAKGEIFEGLAANGTAIINGDDEYAPLWRELASPRQVLTFGFSEGCSVQGRLVETSRSQVIDIQTGAESFRVKLNVPGKHNAANALAATAVAIALGLDSSIIAQGLESFKGVKGRLRMVKTTSGATLLDDTYNANPGSFAAAIDVLTQHRGQRLLVMGDMGELGPDSADLHRIIGEQAARAGVQALIGFGDLSCHAVREFGEGARHFDDIDELIKSVASSLSDNTTVLIKGSRAMRMERVVQALLQGVEN